MIEHRHELTFICDACPEGDRAMLIVTDRTKTEIYGEARRLGWFERPGQNIALCPAHKWIGKDKIEYSYVRLEVEARAQTRKGEDG